MSRRGGRAVSYTHLDVYKRQAQEVRAGQPVVITIARDYGAEGHEIGKMLSMELGIPLYDNELLVLSLIHISAYSRLKAPCVVRVEGGSYRVNSTLRIRGCS